jgi:addiction module HigA family antidote
MKRDQTHAPTHPGELLRNDVLPSIKKSPAEFARLLRISSKELDSILRERERVSLQVADRLGDLIGNGASFWIQMQKAHDEWHSHLK